VVSVSGDGLQTLPRVEKIIYRFLTNEYASAKKHFKGLSHIFGNCVSCIISIY